jgi:hypothetical protein
MTDRSLSQGLPDEWNRAGYAAREPHYYRADPFGATTARAYHASPATGATGATGANSANGRDMVRPEAGRQAGGVSGSAPPEAADTTGLIGALLDFGFTSFVTPKVIKVLYVLVMIGTVASALAFTIMVFKVSATFGILTLVFGDPLIILIVMAIYRIVLEFFVVTFRAAEDIRALRDHGDMT